MPRSRVGSPELAAHCLRLLLVQPGRYRATWASRADKVPPGDISQAAVAKVIADHLRDHGQLEDDMGAYRVLKDRVNRALTGQAVTPSTLRLFSRAFLFSQEDARQLWSSFLGIASDQVTYLIEDLHLPPAQAAALRPRGYQIVSIYEVHEIGDDGMPVGHRTRQVIRATVDGLTHCPIRFDTNTLTVAVPGRSVSDLYVCPDGMYAIDVLLPRILQVGDEQEIEYKIRYTAPPASTQSFRRSALATSIDEAEIGVQFSSLRRPRNVWWGVWQHLDGEPALREPVELHPERYSVFKKIKSAARTVFGFAWDWE